MPKLRLSNGTVLEISNDFYKETKLDFVDDNIPFPIPERFTEGTEVLVKNYPLTDNSINNINLSQMINMLIVSDFLGMYETNEKIINIILGHIDTHRESYTNDEKIQIIELFRQVPITLSTDMIKDFFYVSDNIIEVENEYLDSNRDGSLILTKNGNNIVSYSISNELNGLIVTESSDYFGPSYIRSENIYFINDKQYMVDTHDRNTFDGIWSKDNSKYLVLGDEFVYTIKDRKTNTDISKLKFHGEININYGTIINSIYFNWIILHYDTNKFYIYNKGNYIDIDLNSYVTNPSNESLDTIFIFSPTEDTCGIICKSSDDNNINLMDIIILNNTNIIHSKETVIDSSISYEINTNIISNIYNCIAIDNKYIYYPYCTVNEDESLIFELYRDEIYGNDSVYIKDINGRIDEDHIILYNRLNDRFIESIHYDRESCPLGDDYKECHETIVYDLLPYRDFIEYLESNL